MKKHLKLSTSLNELEKIFNKTMPEFTFFREIIREDNFICNMKKEIGYITNFDSFHNFFITGVIMLSTSFIWIPCQILSLKFNINFFTRFIKLNILLNKNRQKKINQIIKNNKESLDFYEKCIGKDNELKNLINSNGKILSEDIKHNKARLESADYIQLKIEEMYSVYLKDKESFLDKYLNYAKFGKENEIGCNYFSLVFQDYLNNKELKKKENSKKSSILKFEKKS